MPKSVKYFSSTMSGAPALSGTAGALIGVLDACLVNGFGSVTLTSLVVASNVATATVSGGHNFANYSGTLGPVITIAGATPAGLNGEWRINVTSSTQFTFATTGLSDQTASGTITANRSPAGYSKVYSGTNLAAYQANDVTSTRCYLRVDDTAAQTATVTSYETMSDINTGTNGFTGYIYKSTTANGTARPYRVFADPKAVLLHLFNGYALNGGYFWGDIIPYYSADQYHCASIFGASTAQGAGIAIAVPRSSSGHAICRSYTQLGSQVSMLNYSHYLASNGNYWSDQAAAYPSVVSGGIYAWPIDLWESTTIPRGLMPGLYAPAHNSSSQPADGAAITNVSPDNTRIYFVNGFGSSSAMLVEIVGPWR